MRAVLKFTRAMGQAGGVLALWCCLGLPAAAGATSDCEPGLATLVVLRGDVRYKSPQADWRDATLNQPLCTGDEISVGASSRAALRLSNDVTFPLDQQTRVIVRGSDKEGKLQIELVSGRINVVTGAATPIRILTPHGALDTATADFSVSVSPERGALSVFEGGVALNTAQGSLELQGDESAFFTQWAAPKRDIAIKPRDSVQWVLQYPVILPRGTAASSAWSDAARTFESGRSLDALIALDQIRPEARNAEYFVYRAHLLTLVGRPEDAAATIDAALNINPDLAEAWALRAIIDLGRSDASAAQQHADKAVQLNPASPAAYLAQSYAYQANRRLADALASAQRMVELAPDSALAYTRIAELALTRGERVTAMHAARRAEQLDPNSAHAKSMLGFTLLSQADDTAAFAAFEAAMKLDSADPSARMGLGLARIRAGQLQAGRADLELATSLDPENPLLHAYLGRAYAEEGRAAAAAQQYERAKRIDPQDPTAYFFSAVQLAENNAPASAREQMQEAMRRNENRAVYRGRALIEEDQALGIANEVGMDRVLGFDDVARAEASAAVAADTQSGTLHRALADAMATSSRSGLARQSEYLQSALRSPLGALPVPLSLSENVRAGGASMSPQHGFFQAVEPGHTGYNDYGAVFNRSGFQGQIDATLGAKDSLGDQVHLAGSHGALGWSLSHLNFSTDGFGQYDRDGFTGFDRLDDTVWRGVLQADITPDTRLHVERREFSSTRGSMLNPAEPFFYTPQEITQWQGSSRVGFRHRFGDAHEILLYNAVDRMRFTIDNLPSPALSASSLSTIRQAIQSHVSAPEAQYQYRGTHVRLIVGRSYMHAEEDWDTSFDYLGIRFADSTHYSSKATALYGYLYLTPSPTLSIELGVARERQNQAAGLEQGLTSPKAGLRWEAIPGGILRLVSMRGVNRFWASGATLEPSQVAGFNQYYDDGFAARTERRGIGWDQQLAHGVSWGAEHSLRSIGRPNNASPPAYSWWYEREGRVYVNWAIPPALTQRVLPGWESALSLRYDRIVYTRPETDTGAEEVSDYFPQHLRLGLKLFHPRGIGLSVAASRVLDRGTYQLRASDGAVITSSFSDRFLVWDAAISYQLPNKRGQLLLGGMNLADHSLGQYVEMDPTSPRFSPQRYVYAKLLWHF